MLSPGGVGCEKIKEPIMKVNSNLLFHHCFSIWGGLEVDNTKEKMLNQIEFKLKNGAIKL